MIKRRQESAQHVPKLKKGMVTKQQPRRHYTIEFVQNLSSTPLALFNTPMPNRAVYSQMANGAGAKIKTFKNIKEAVVQSRMKRRAAQREIQDVPIAAAFNVSPVFSKQVSILSSSLESPERS